jgi:hypothetical protein
MNITTIFMRGTLDMPLERRSITPIISNSILSHKDTLDNQSSSLEEIGL